MFANTSLCVLNLGFPDVCEVPTPLGPVPTPFPNIALSATHVPSQDTVIIGGGLAENLATEGTISNGDEPGIALGAVSGTIMAPDRYLEGSLKVLIGGMFATRLTSPTLANEDNAPGLSVTPSQFCVCLLS